MSANHTVPSVSDEYKMPVGKYRGKMIKEVPAAYLLWAHDKAPNMDDRLVKHICDNLESITKRAQWEREETDRINREGITT